MLRSVLLAVSLAACVLSAGAVVAGHHELVPLVFWSGVLALAVLLERWRYRSRGAVDTAGQGAWEKTDERFIDPESGQAMQVLYNPRTGERRYEAAGD